MEFGVVCQLNRGRVIEAGPSSLIRLTGWLDEIMRKATAADPDKQFHYLSGIGCP